jgi:hypothetical protein
MVTGVNAAGMCKYRSFPSTVPVLRLIVPLPLASTRLTDVEYKYPPERVLTCLQKMCEGVCAESFVCLYEVTQFYKNILSLLGTHSMKKKPAKRKKRAFTERT